MTTFIFQYKVTLIRKDDVTINIFGVFVYVGKGHVLQYRVLPGYEGIVSFLSVNDLHNAWKVLKVE